MISQHAVAWVDSSKTLPRCGLEERAHCRLPDGVAIRPPDARIAARWLTQCTISRSRGVQRIRVLHRVHPVWSSPHCDSQGPHSLPTRVVLQSPSRRRATIATAKWGVGGLAGDRCSGLSRDCFLTSMRALAPRHTPAHACILRLVLPVLPVLPCPDLPAQMLAHPHGPWRTHHPPVQRKHPTIWACVGTMPLSVWNTRLKLGHLAIRAS